jgi:hypothetical protein
MGEARCGRVAPVACVFLFIHSSIHLDIVIVRPEEQSGQTRCCAMALGQLMPFSLFAS